MKKAVVSLIAISLLLSGCATVTGPKVTSFEIEQAKGRLKAKAARHRFDQLQKVSDIGYCLIMNLPQEDRRRGYPFIGIKVVKITGTLKNAYNLTQDKGVVIVVVVKDSPAEKAGLEAGDVILRIDNRRIIGLEGFASAISPARLKDKDNITIEINRGGENKIFACDVISAPRNVAFDMIDEQEVNAGAGSNIILVTYGLMRFAESDDEIAVILGHELAHITRGHVSKTIGTEMIVGLAALGVGILSEQLSPGSGSDIFRAASGIGQVFGRSYSRDLEREADYFGLKYVKLAGYDYKSASGVWERFAVEVPQSMIRNYLNTHPTSPERMVRIEKIIEELEAENSGVKIEE